MTKFWNDYYLPRSLQEALDLLARYDGRARVVAGGTDLFLDFQGAYISGERPFFDALVDVTRLQGANALYEEDGWIVIGCGVTHTQIVASPLVQARATALAQACSVVGGPQVRNVATLVGNVAHALPAADGTIALMALGAEAQVARCNEPAYNEPINQLAGEPSTMLSWRPLASLFKGPGVSAVDATRELIAAIRVRPTGECEGSAFTRVMRPQGVALPILGMAARVKATPALPLRSASGTDVAGGARERKKLKAKSKEQIAEVEDVAISAGPVAPVPFRAQETEAFVRGKRLSDDTIAQAAQVLLSEVNPRTSPHRATREYRTELLPALLRQVLLEAMDRAIENEPMNQWDK